MRYLERRSYYRRSRGRVYRVYRKYPTKKVRRPREGGGGRRARRFFARGGFANYFPIASPPLPADRPLLTVAGKTDARDLPFRQVEQTPTADFNRNSDYAEVAGAVGQGRTIISFSLSYGDTALRSSAAALITGFSTPRNYFSATCSPCDTLFSFPLARSLGLFRTNISFSSPARALSTSNFLAVSFLLFLSRIVSHEISR